MTLDKFWRGFYGDEILSQLNSVSNVNDESTIFVQLWGGCCFALPSSLPLRVTAN